MKYQARSWFVGVLFVFALIISLSQPVRAENPPEEASVNGKYYNLKQVLSCPSDISQYGIFKDYGKWNGGPWCGQQGESGYWVWVAPNWYVWSDKRSQIPAMASLNGKYTNLIQVLNCPSDRGQYGEFNDYGFWDGGSWCGQQGKAGYWVWVAPNWYIWEMK